MMPDANGVMQMRGSERERREGDGAFIEIGRRSSVILMQLIVARARLIRRLT